MTLQLKDLKVGEIYKYDKCHVCVYPNGECLTAGTGYDPISNWTWNLDIEEASKEEKQHLLACIKAGKFVPKEEINRSKTVNVEDLCYPDVVHCSNKEEALKLKEFFPDIPDYALSKAYILISGSGSCGTSNSKYPNDTYNNYEFSDIIFPNKEEYNKQAMKENKEWWKKLRKGDFVVSLEKMGNTRGKDTIHEIYENFYSCISYYRLDYPLNNATSTSFNEFRPATEQEIALYKAHRKPVHINTPFPEEKVSRELEITLEQLREMVKSLVDKHREKIKQKLSELFAPNIASLNKKYYKVFFDFLNGLSTKEMTKEELLAEAKRRYPQGTTHHGYKSKETYIVKGELYWESDNIFSKFQSGCIYNGYDKTWAEIISLPESSKEGSLKHYVCETCNGEGKVMSAKLYPSGHTEVWENCPCCNGDGERYIIGIDPISSCKKTKNILLLGEFEPIIINEYKEYGINNLI